MIARDPMVSQTAPRIEVRGFQVLDAARWSLWLTFAALPLYVVRWHYGPLPTTLLETLIGITVVLYVIGRWREGVRRPLRTPLDVPIVLLLVAGAISVFVPKDHMAALGLYRAYFVEPVLLFYVAVDLFRDRDTLTRALIAFAAGSSLFAFLNFAAFGTALQANAIHVGNAPTALYNNPNYVAMYMEPAVAVATGFVLFATATRWRLFGIVWLGITGIALILTFSKGGYVALAALAVLVIAAVPRWRLPLFVGLAAVALALSRVPLVAERLATLYGSMIARAVIYGATIEMLKQSPILGVGLGGYNYLFRHHQPTPYPHDIWLSMWVELGLLGLVAFVAILGVLLVRGIRRWPAVPRPERAAYWGSLAALGTIVVHGFVDTPYFKNDMSAEFWLVAAIPVAIVAAAASSGAKAEARPAN